MSAHKTKKPRRSRTGKTKSPRLVRPKGRGPTRQEWQTFYDSLSPAQQQKCDELRRCNENIASGELDALHDFGHHLAEGHEDTSTYGAKFVEKMALLLNISPANLYERMRFYQRLASAESFARLKSLRTASTGTPLSYSHVVKVLKCESDELFWDFLHRAADNSWTVSQLAAVVKENTRAGSISGSKRGRTTTTPPDVAGKVLQAIETMVPLVKRARLWASEEEGLLSAVQAIESSQVLPAWVMRIEEALAKLDEGAAGIAAARANFVAALDVVKDKIAEKSRISRPREQTLRGHPAVAELLGEVG